MQDRYAGDVGDFGKFSLLRHLLNASRNRLGVIWYLFPDESHNTDGSHISYLSNPAFLQCDKDLCEMLSNVVHGNRSVASLEKEGILPDNTLYFFERLNFHLQNPSQSKKDKIKRDEERKEWLRKAVNRVSECNIIFLDPDNGLEISSCSKISQMKAGKFAFYSEIVKLSKEKDITVIYHHLNRHKNYGTHANQIRTIAAKLRKHIKPTGGIFALRYRPYSPRAYFLLTAKLYKKRTRENLVNFLNGSCGRFWDCFYEEKTF